MGTIYNIQRFSLHDGPGIRTTVFMKGCPLRCEWCHNPESQKVRPQISLFVERCLACGRCMAVCDRHSFEDGIHRIDHGACEGCGRCVEQCPADAMELLGREASVEEIIEEVERDSAFYSTSGGGMTVSGGEPTMQTAFAAQILAAAKAKGIHTAIETCGYAPWSAYEQLLPYTDMFLYDVKQMDSELHKEYTGVDNSRILENLSNLCMNAVDAEIVVRTPVIPGYNDQPENFRSLASFLLKLERLPRVEVLPYNPLAGSKYSRLGMEYIPGNLDETDGTSPDALCEILKEFGIEAIVMR